MSNIKSGNTPRSTQPKSDPTPEYIYPSGVWHIWVAALLPASTMIVGVGAVLVPPGGKDDPLLISGEVGASVGAGPAGVVSAAGVEPRLEEVRREGAGAGAAGVCAAAGCWRVLAGAGGVASGAIVASSSFLRASFLGAFSASMARVRGRLGVAACLGAVSLRCFVVGVVLVGMEIYRGIGAVNGAVLRSCRARSYSVFNAC